MLTKAERDGARRNGTSPAWLADQLMADLDAQELEVARLTAENDRLTVIARAEEWQARYWAEHDAVADREATIMAERANSAAMRDALEYVKRTGMMHREDAGGVCYDWCPACAVDAALQSDAGAKLLADHATELQGWWEKTKTMAADLAAVVARKDLELAAYRKALEEIVSAKSNWQQNVGSYAGGETWYGFACRLQKLAEAALQSSDPGKALLDAHAAELAACNLRIAAFRKILFSLWRENEIPARFHVAATSALEREDSGKEIIRELAALRQRAEAAEARASCDGSTERSHAESTKAAIAALWAANPEIAYENPAQVIAWLKGRAEAAELFRATLERPRGLGSGQCCDPVIDGEICALLRRAEAAERDRNILARAIDPMSETPAAERSTESLVAWAEGLRGQVKAAEAALASCRIHAQQLTDNATGLGRCLATARKSIAKQSDELATLRVSQAADLNRIEELYNRLIRELEEGKRKAEAERDAAKRDSARLDWLEGELEREQQYLSNQRTYIAALFRCNQPITRAAIDAIAAGEPKGQ